MIHLLVLFLAVSCALWVLDEVRRLRAAVELKENNLQKYLVLSQGVASSRRHDPKEAAARLEKLLAGRSWEDTFAGLEPRVVLTESGPLLQLIKRNGRDSSDTGKAHK